MADVKRRLDDTDQHVNTAQLDADRSKRAKTNGIALDDSTVFSFLRAPIVDSIVADKNIVPSKLTTSAAVARVCHNNFNYSWSRSTKFPPSTTKAGRPSRKKKEVAADVPGPAKLPNTWHHRNFPSVESNIPFSSPPTVVLEDYLRPELQELVVVLVSDNHPAFNSSWAPLLTAAYKVTRPDRLSKASQGLSILPFAEQGLSILPFADESH
jgi:hypothetical protein